MRLLLVRHAIAEPRESFRRSGLGDDLRPLTARGERRMEQASQGLAGLIDEPVTVLSSPFRRALQTAEIFASAVDGGAPTEVAWLAPGSDAEVILVALNRHAADADGLLALVGHEPDLGELVGMALSGQPAGFAPMKKGGACLLAFPGPALPAGAVLQWFLTPGQLRALA